MIHQIDGIMVLKGVNSMNLFVLVGIAAVAVALIILVLVLEQKDKEIGRAHV